MQLSRRFRLTLGVIFVPHQVGAVDQRSALPLGAAVVGVRERKMVHAGVVSTACAILAALEAAKYAPRQLAMGVSY